jgi:sugar/nucleoside kinase (ribokinase family)
MTSDGSVFFVGDVALDEYYSAPYFPKIKEKVIVHTLPAQMGGMIANAACIYCSYGRKARFMTALNSGPMSKRLCEELERAGLDTSLMVWDDTLPDSKTIVILAEDEHTIFIPTMGIQRIEIPKSTLEELRASDYIYSDFWEIAPLACGNLKGAELLSDLREHGCRLWCDLDVAELGEGHEELLGLVDTLFINEAGYANLAKALGPDPVRELHARGTNTVVVTLAEHGVDVHRVGEETIHADGIPVDVVDVTGAGDTFCSTFLFASTVSDDLELCTRFANIAAARSVTLMGPRAGAGGVPAVLDFMETVGIDAGPYEVFLQRSE